MGSIVDKYYTPMKRAAPLLLTPSAAYLFLFFATVPGHIDPTLDEEVLWDTWQNVVKFLLVCALAGQVLCIACIIFVFVAAPADRQKLPGNLTACLMCIAIWWVVVFWVQMALV